MQTTGEIELLDLSGRMLYRRGFQGSSETIHVDQIPSGLYLIHVKTSVGKTFKRQVMVL